MGEQQERRKSRVSMMVTNPNKPPLGANKSMALMTSKSIRKLSGQSMSRMKMRRMSFGFGGGIAGIRAAARNSQIGMEFKRPALLYLPTYQLDPHPDEVFDVPVVTQMVNVALDELWTGHKYSSAESPTLALGIAGALMRKVKLMNYNRYRIISVVTIGQKRSQSYNNAVAFLWDHERDTYVDVQRQCTTNFIQVTIFGVYLD